MLKNPAVMCRVRKILAIKYNILYKKIQTASQRHSQDFWLHFPILHWQLQHWIYVQGIKKVKVAHTRLPSVGFRSWSRFLAVSLQVTWVINPAVGCQYFPPSLQLSPQPLRGLLPISLLGEQRHNGCEQFAQDCYLTLSWLRLEPRSFCTWVQQANHSATEPPRARCTGK